MARTSVIYVRVPTAMHDEMLKAAGQYEVTLTTLVRRAMAVYLSEKFAYVPVEEVTLP